MDFADALGSNNASLTLARNSGAGVASMTWNTNDNAGMDLAVRRSRAIDFIYTTHHPFGQAAAWVLKYSGIPV